MISLPFKLVPDQLYWIAIGALVIGVGTQTWRLASAKADTSSAQVALREEKAARAAETAARATAAVNYGKQVSQLEHDHALTQQKLENQNAELQKELENRRAADQRIIAGLRGNLANYTAGNRRPGETDAAALERYQHRLDVVGGLLGESFDLLIEGRGIVERRDAEVGRLLDQIRIDRLACEGPPVVKP